MATLAIGSTVSGQTTTTPSTLPSPVYASGKGTGSWKDGNSWVGGTSPTSANSVYIGSTTGGGALTAAIYLPQDETAANVVLGNGSSSGTPASGTLTLKGHTLTITGSLDIGSATGGTGTISEGGGHFTATTLNVYGSNSFGFGSKDVVQNLSLSGGGVATTAATGNVTTGVALASGSYLTLGAALNVGSGTVDVEGGSTLNMQNKGLTAGTLTLAGGSGSSVVIVSNPGTLNVGSLIMGNSSMVGNENLTLGGKDSVASFQLVGASATNSTSLTTSKGTTIGGGTVGPYSSLNLGANLSVGGGTGTVTVQGAGSALNLGGNTLTAGTLNVGLTGSGATLSRGSGGALDVTQLNMANGQTLTINGNDSIANFTLNSTTTSGSTTLATSGNVSVSGLGQVYSGSTLTLGGNLTIGTLDIEGAGSTLNLKGHLLTAGTLDLGTSVSGAVDVANHVAPDPLNVGTLNLGTGQSLSLIAADIVGTANLMGGATLTTAATGNITTGATLQTGSELNLGANMNVTGTVDVQSGSTLDAHGNSITAGSLLLGVNGSPGGTSAIHINQLDVANLSEAQGSSAFIKGGVIGSVLSLSGSSTLTVHQTNGMGLTFDGTSLTISDTKNDKSKLVLDFSGLGWDLKLLDSNAPLGGWMSAIDAMIADKQIVLNAPAGDHVIVFDQGGYTYVGIVPEPSSLLMTCVMGGGALLGVVYRRRRVG